MRHDKNKIVFFCSIILFPSLLAPAYKIITEPCLAAEETINETKANSTTSDTLLKYSPNDSSLNMYPFNKSDRNPFAPLISKYGLILIPKEVDITGLALKGVIYSQSGPVAVIDDEILEEGDNIGVYIVVKIEEKKVILKKGNEQFTLKLEGE